MCLEGGECVKLNFVDTQDFSKEEIAKSQRAGV